MNYSFSVDKLQGRNKISKQEINPSDHTEIMKAAASGNHGRLRWVCILPNQVRQVRQYTTKPCETEVRQFTTKPCGVEVSLYTTKPCEAKVGLFTASPAWTVGPTALVWVYVLHLKGRFFVDQGERLRPEKWKKPLLYNWCTVGWLPNVVRLPMSLATCQAYWDSKAIRTIIKKVISILS